MRFSRVPLLYLVAVLLLVLFPLRSSATAAVSGQVPTLEIDQLGKGTAPLGGKWQFHVGDDPSWANPEVDDSNWEQITADEPWGAQRHESYTGYAWYRRHISISPAQGASPNVALWIRAIDDVYEIYWNGVPVAHLGSFPPKLDWLSGIPPQTYGLGPIRDGVLAVRVFKAPLASNDPGTVGGFEKAPVIGSAEAIANLKAAGDFNWLRRRQFNFGLTSLYTLTGLLSLIVWLRDRKQWLLFWMAVFTFMPLAELCFVGLGLQVSFRWLTLLTQTTIQVREIAQWFVLIWLLQLHEHPPLLKLVRIMAFVSLIAGTLDGCLAFSYPYILSQNGMQILDAILTGLLLPGEVIPVVLVIYALVRRKRLDSARWIVATFALLSGTAYSISNIGAQGIRFTHWTFPNLYTDPLFTLFGSAFSPQLILRILLFLSIAYAVTRYAIEYRRRQASLEQEFQNARALQQVLIPETLPELPGYAVTSSYRPAQEVGGDFFQIIELEGEDYGSTLIVLGDVSGKGLKAAMTVALIVGALRTLVETSSSPGDILAGLNRRLYGRMQDGFATCVALRITPDGKCFLASAGHPAPYHNLREIDVPGALPLGLVPAVYYEEIFVHLREGDQFSLYTDGLLEARNASGEIFSFERLEALFADQPDAVRASDAAVAFGQDDDITVLTLTRLGQGQEPTITVTLPRLTRQPA